MAINPNLLVIKPVDELESVTGLQAGEILFYDGGNNLKKISVDTFNNLSKTAKPLKPTDPTPTVEGLYIPTESGNYANAAGLIAQEGYYTLFFFDGTVWTKSETLLPTGGTNPSSLLVGNNWDISNNQKNKNKTLTSNQTISVTINNGDEGYLLVSGNGYTVTLLNVVIPIGVDPILIGVKRMMNTTFLKYAVLEDYINSTIGTFLNFAGTDLVNSSNVWTTSGQNASWGHTGIDSATLAANTAGRIWFQYLTGNGLACLGFTIGSTAVGFAGMKMGFWKNTTPDNWGKTENGTISVFSTLTPVNGRFYGILRKTTGEFVWQYSDDEINWTDILTFTTVSTDALRAVVDINSAGVLTRPKRNY